MAWTPSLQPRATADHTPGAKRTEGRRITAESQPAKIIYLPHGTSEPRPRGWRADVAPLTTRKTEPSAPGMPGRD